MRIQKINVHNPFIHYDNLALDLPGSGLYFLLGENGSGKSSLIREILYGKVEMVFDQPGEESFSRLKRHALFAYMPQEMNSCKISVAEYLSRENPNVDGRRQEELMHYFGLHSLNRKENVAKLSGGEITRLALVAAFSKNTPYVILDEPSNYLDDGAVRLLAELLEKEKRHKAILIASHDARLTEMKGARMTLEAGAGRLLVLEFPEAGEAPRGQWKQDVDLKRIGKRKIQQDNYIIIFINLFILLGGLCLFVMYHFGTNLYWGENFFDEQELPKNVILFFNNSTFSDDIYDDSVRYLRELHVPEEKWRGRDSLFKTTDIPALSDGGSRTIFMKDIRLSKLRMYNENRYEYSLEYPGEESPWVDGLEKNMISIPEIIWHSDLMMSNLIGLNLYLIDGRLPRDGAREIAMSETLLKEFFQLSYEEAAGRELEIAGSSYTLVGQLWDDYCLLSYEEGTERMGVYRYTPESFAAYWEADTAYRAAQDIIKPIFGPEDFVVVCKSAEDAEQCFREFLPLYPGCAFMSNLASHLYYSSYSRELFFRGLLLFGGISLGVGLLMGLEFRYIFKLARTKLALYEAYYLDRIQLRQGFKGFLLKGMALSFGAGLMTVPVLTLLAKTNILVWGWGLALLVLAGIILYLPSMLQIHLGFSSKEKC